MGIQNISNFEWFDSPDINIMKSSLEKLKLLNAIDNNYHVTNIGKEMIKFPIDPCFSKSIIIAAMENQCTDEIITLVSLLNEENLLYSLNNKNNNRLSFSSIDGDVIMLLNLWKSYQLNLKQAKISYFVLFFIIFKINNQLNKLFLIGLKNTMSIFLVGIMLLKLDLK